LDSFSSFLASFSYFLDFFFSRFSSRFAFRLELLPSESLESLSELSSCDLDCFFYRFSSRFPLRFASSIEFFCDFFLSDSLSELESVSMV